MDFEEAVERAKEFLTWVAGYGYPRLLSARLENGVWVLTFDVGVLEEKIVVVKVDDRTGKVVDFYTSS